MTAKSAFTTNLGIGIAPELEAASSPELFAEVARIYNALRSLAINLDNLTGNTYFDDVDRLTVKPQHTIKSDLQNKLYVKYNVNITAGQTVGLTNVSGELQAVVGVAGSVRGFAVETKLAGEIGLVVLLGLWVSSGFTPGTLYYASTSVAGALTSVRPGGGANPIQPVAFALSSTEAFFNPSLLAI